MAFVLSGGERHKSKYLHPLLEAGLLIVSTGYDGGRPYPEPGEG